MQFITNQSKKIQVLFSRTLFSCLFCSFRTMLFDNHKNMFEMINFNPNLLANLQGYIQDRLLSNFMLSYIIGFRLVRCILGSSKQFLSKLFGPSKYFYTKGGHVDDHYW